MQQRDKPKAVTKEVIAKMAIGDYGVLVTDASGDTLQPSSGVVLRVFTLISHIDETGVSWNISDGTDEVKMTNSSGSTRLGAGIIMSEIDGWIGSKALGGFGMPQLILDENLTLNQSKSFSSGNCAMAMYQVVDS